MENSSLPIVCSTRSISYFLTQGTRSVLPLVQLFCDVSLHVVPIRGWKPEDTAHIPRGRVFSCRHNPEKGTWPFTWTPEKQKRVLLPLLYTDDSRNQVWYFDHPDSDSLMMTTQENILHVFRLFGSELTELITQCQTSQIHPQRFVKDAIMNNRLVAIFLQDVSLPVLYNTLFPGPDTTTEKTPAMELLAVVSRLGPVPIVIDISPQAFEYIAQLVANREEETLSFGHPIGCVRAVNAIAHGLRTFCT